MNSFSFYQLAILAVLTASVGKIGSHSYKFDEVTWQTMGEQFFCCSFIITRF